MKNVFVLPGFLLAFAFEEATLEPAFWWKAALALAAAVLVVGLWPLSRLGTEFMPPLDEGDLMYMPTTLPGLSIGKAQELLQQTDRLIKQVPEVKQVFGKIGRADSATDPAPLTMIETVIRLKPRDEWRPGITIEDIKRELDRTVQVPGLTNAWVWPIKTRIDMLATGIRTPVGVKIFGPDLAELERPIKLKHKENLLNILMKVPVNRRLHPLSFSLLRYGFLSRGMCDHRYFSFKE